MVSHASPSLPEAWQLPLPRLLVNPCCPDAHPRLSAGAFWMGFALLQILVAAQLFTVGHNADQV